MKHQSKILLYLLSLSLLLPLTSAHANQDPYLSAQKNLSFSIYKPVNTLALKDPSLKILPCGDGSKDWVSITYAQGSKSVEVMETSLGAHCSNPGLAKKLQNILINNVPAKLYLYCDPSNIKACTISNFTKLGGYLLFSLPGYYKLKPVQLQLQASKGITYKELLLVARSMTPASTKPSN